MIEAPGGPERLGPLDPAAMSDAQRAAVAAVVSGPRGKLQGPFVPMLRSPEFMECAQKVGAYIRYQSVLPDNLRELAIMITARHWSQPVEWAIHAPIAVAAGISDAVLDAIAEGRAPQGLNEAETAVHAFCLQLHQTQGADDETYGQALAALGEEALVDLIGLCGYYAMLAMIMNVARTTVRD